MRIVIAGAGRVGGTVAEVLAEEGHDVSIIDRDVELISHISNDVDAICLEGSATDVNILKEAGAGEADMFLAITEADETNLVSSVLAGNMGADHIVARVRNPEYLGKEEDLKKALGISLLINPEMLCAKEISEIIQFNGAVRSATFASSDTEILKYKVKAKDKLCGTTLKSIKGTSNADILVCYVIRGDEVFIPNPEYIIRENDVLAVTGSGHSPKRFLNNISTNYKTIREAMIYGGGRITVFLSRLLLQMGVSVTIIEEKRERCVRLCELVPHANIVCGDGTKRDVMLEEGIEHADAFIALTEDDGNNIISSIYAKHCGVGIVIAKAEHLHFAEMMEDSIIDSIVTPKILAARQITGYVRAVSNSSDKEIESMYYLENGELDALEFQIDSDSGITDTKLKDIGIREDVEVIAIIRNAGTIVPDGDSIIKNGDNVVVIAKADEIHSIKDILK